MTLPAQDDTFPPDAIEGELIPIEPTSHMAIMPAVSADGMLERYHTIVKIKDTVMRPEVHYGVIPGSKKPSLLKPGAEVLCAAFGLFPDFIELDVPNLNHIFATAGEGVPFFMYRYKCVLTSRDRRFEVGAGIGSCNSWEKKYKFRQGELICPECFSTAVFKSKKEPGWYCWDKKGGCGAQFGADDKRITDQDRGQVTNPDIADVINTIDKIAQKRALVAATLIAVGASDFFTQDIEDMPGFEKPHWTVGFDMSRIYAKGADIGLKRNEVLAAAGVKNLKQFPESANALFIAMKAYAAAKSQVVLDDDDHLQDYEGRAPLDGEEARQNYGG